MDGRTDREQLQLRKQALILEGESHRRLLAVEWRQVQSATAWVGAAGKLGFRARRWWPVLAPLLGMAVARRYRRPAPKFSRTGSLLNLLGLGYSLWKKLGSPRAQVSTPSQPPR